MRRALPIVINMESTALAKAHVERAVRFRYPLI
jgi:hypothetical protein